jgi:hypothetical protein
MGVYAFEYLRLPWWKIGLVIATYQVARALANLLIPFVGIVRYHVLGVIFGIAGYSIHAISRFAVPLIGLSEVITCMQHYVKIDYSDMGLLVLRERLRLQYAFNVAGTAFGFLVTAMLYSFISVHAAAGYGIGLEAAELLCTFSYLYLARYVPESHPSNAYKPKTEMLEDKGHGTPLQLNKRQNRPALSSLRQQVTFKELNEADVQMDIKLNGMDEDETRMALASIASCEVNFPGIMRKGSALGRMLSQVPKERDDHSSSHKTKTVTPWINYLIAITFAIQALMIGSILSTGPILIYLIYGLPLQNVGYIFAGGETIGTVALMFLVSSENQKAVRKFFPGPFNMIIIIGSLGALALLLAVNDIRLTIAALTIIMGLNDFGTSLTAEAQGATVAAEDYARINMLGNVARRMGNMVTAVLGPIMFGTVYYLPFIVFGVLTIIWIGVMAFAFHVRGSQIAKKLNKGSEKQGHINQKVPSGLKLYLKYATFVSAEHRAVQE